MDLERKSVESTAIGRQLREESLGREEPEVGENCGCRVDCRVRTKRCLRFTTDDSRVWLLCQ